MMSFVAFTQAVGQLKGIKRTGWILAGVPEPESVAEHSYRLAMFCMVLGRKLHLDAEKLTYMALIHDLAEVVIGDIVTERGTHRVDEIGRQTKRRLEKEALQVLFSELENGGQFLSLWEEFEANETREARFARQLDKLEMAAQALEYEGQVESTRLDEFWDNTRKHLKEPELIALLDELACQRKAKCSDKGVEPENEVVSDLTLASSSL